MIQPYSDRLHPWPYSCSSRRRQLLGLPYRPKQPGICFPRTLFWHLEVVQTEPFGPGATQFPCEATDAAFSQSGHQRAVYHSNVYRQLSVVHGVTCLTCLPRQWATTPHAQVPAGSGGPPLPSGEVLALGMRVQLRVLFV
jgi:hypothetical protein